MIIDLKNIHQGKVFKIKDKNKADIFHLLCGDNNISRKELSNILKIRPATVSNLVQELIEDKLIIESDNLLSKGRGRPEYSLSVNYNIFLCIALYIDTNTLKGVLLNYNEEILYSSSIVIDEDIDNDFFIKCTIDLISNILRQVPEQSKLIGIGFSLTGVLNKEKKELIFTSRWPNLSNLKLDKIEEKFGYEIRIQHELNTSLKYLLLSNADYRVNGTAILHWGYGIGASYSNNGVILHSNSGRSIEIGHLPFIMENPNKCNCGAYGCLETVASLRALKKDLSKFYQGPISEKDFPSLKSNEDLCSLPSVTYAIEYMALALSYFVKLFFPQRIIITGPFFRNQRILDEVLRKFKSHFPKHSENNLNIIKMDSISKGEIFGCTYDFFEEKLRSKMISHFNWK
jgi:predicted NBD/HSP70 family sugar kinase